MPYTGFTVNKELFVVNEGSDNSKTLPPGMYTFHILPMGGPKLFKKMGHTHDTLVDLPGTAYDQVTKEINNFLNPTTKQSFIDYGFLYKRSSLLYGPPGCHAKGTKILMYDGSIKNVENVKIGDVLMGPDSQPREVLGLAQGRQEMVKITPIKGDPFIVNRDHILHLTPSGENVTIKTPINIKFSDYIKQSLCFQERLKLTRTGVEFNQTKNLPINSYIFGVWLGDGTSTKAEITTMDKEIKEALKEFAENTKLDLKARNSKTSGKADTFALTNGRGTKNSFLDSLNELEVINNKHIPQIYKTSSREDRLQLLAGILDTDGSLTCNGYDYISVSRNLAEDVVFLSRSLGLAAYLAETTKSCMYKGEKKEGSYYRVSISGNIAEIPVKLTRKKAKERSQIKNVLRTGFTYELLPVDDYFGFSLDKDHLYLTSDFTIHHNTGKTCIVNRVATDVVKNGGIVIFNPNPGELKEAFNILDDLQPEVTTMVIFEELDKMLQRYEGELLNLLDGEVQKNNVVYLATTNFIDQIPARIRRPGRFSTSVEVDYPTHQARVIYLDTKLKNTEEANQWAELTEGFSVDELKELVLSVKCLGYSPEVVIPRIRSGRAVLTENANPRMVHNSYTERLQNSMQEIEATMEKMNYRSEGNVYFSGDSVNPSTYLDEGDAGQ